ncbi:MAG: cupredoxin domain-containing protein [Acidimicrobiales bacterium]
MRIRRLLCAGVVPLALLAGCSSSGSSKGATAVVDIQVSSSGYAPPAVDVARGETVTFKVTNNDSTVHEFVLATTPRA